MFSAYLAIGDSTTAGFGDSVPGIPCRSWTDLVASAFRQIDPAMRYRNLGRNGATAADLLRKQTPQIKEFKADFVSVTVGGNDARAHDWSPERFETEYRAILQAIAAVDAAALTLAYPDVSRASETAGRQLPLKWRLPLLRLREVNDVVRRVSAEFDATLLDMEAFPDAADPHYLSRDFAHPNALGYLRTSEAALELLAERFELPQLAPRASVVS